MAQRKIVGLTSGTEIVGPKEKLKQLEAPGGGAKASETATGNQPLELYPTQVTLFKGDLLIRNNDLQELSRYVGNQLTVNQGTPIVKFFMQLGEKQDQVLLNAKQVKKGEPVKGF